MRSGIGVSEIRYSRLGEVTFSQGRPLLPTEQGGAVVVDRQLLQIWQFADGRTLGEVLARFDDLPLDEVRAALSCLSEGGLLRRGEARSPVVQSASPPLPASARVSVVIVSYNSQAWLDECLPSLAGQTCPPMEIIVVDNGSDADPRPWLAEHYPHVQTLRMPVPSSFAAAINAGVQASAGDYVLMLNPDVRLEPDAIAQMVSVIAGRSDIAAVAPKLRFWWAPAFLNGIGNRQPKAGFGADNALGHLDLGQFDHWDKVPSVCFAAALIPRAAWDAVGPLDDGFPMYYEDLEWSYRARLLGWQIVTAPRAVVYHAFGGRIPSPERASLGARKLQHVLYGRRRFIEKLADDFRWRFVLTFSLEEIARLIVSLARFDWGAARAILNAWAQFRRDRPALSALRDLLQSRRKIDDRMLFASRDKMPPTLMWHGFPEFSWDILKTHYLPWMRTQRIAPEFQSAQTPVRLLILSHGIVGKKMAGPGMRYLEMARALQCDDLAVTLAVPGESDLSVSDVALIPYRESDQNRIRQLVDAHDVVLISGYLLNKFPFLAQTRARLVVDFYDPLILENLHYGADDPAAVRQLRARRMVDLTNRLAQAGDFFVCGNERQRDFWLGVLASNGRINPQTYGQDASLKSLIDVVGIGFPDRPPRADAPFLRGIHPQIPEDARIVLWGGGIWNWLDPLTLVRAWPQVIRRFPDARLVFLGTRHPNPTVPSHKMAAETISLAEEIGEKDRTIIFLEWVEYHDRERLLSEADVGVTLHPLHVETRYSARTRVLDYFWARLPVLITEGDVTSEWVDAYGIGRVVPEADEAAVAAALIDLLDRPKDAFADAFSPLLERFTWPQVVAPLRRYCLEGDFAPDRLERNTALPADSLLRQGWQIWRAAGTRAFAHRVWRYLQWRFS